MPEAASRSAFSFRLKEKVSNLGRDNFVRDLLPESCVALMAEFLVSGRRSSVGQGGAVGALLCCH